MLRYIKVFKCDKTSNIIFSKITKLSIGYPYNNIIVRDNKIENKIVQIL